MKQLKLYQVELQQKTTSVYTVSAKSKAEAKKKAWKRFKPQRNFFNIWADEK